VDKKKEEPREPASTKDELHAKHHVPSEAQVLTVQHRRRRARALFRPIKKRWTTGDKTGVVR